MVGRRGACYLSVGGGRDGKYIVRATFDNETFHHLIDPSRTGGDERLLVGGEEWDYPAQRCVSLEMALKAAKAFVEARALEPSLRWEEVTRARPAAP